MVAYRRLRAWILDGTLPAGAGVSQVQLAKSRGPVREALRLLERDGLIEAEVNQRARVSGFSIEDLEQLYAMRVVTEALAVRVSVPHFTGADLDALGRALSDMDDLAGVDTERWEEPHGRFHRGL